MMTTGELSIIDSSVCIAFFNRQDERFERAKELIEAQTSPLILPDAVLHETLALLRKRVSKALAVKAAKLILISSIFELYVSSEDLVKEALKLFTDTKGRYSYVDCAIVTLANFQHFPVVTFDKHFRDFDLKVVS